MLLKAKIGSALVLSFVLTGCGSQENAAPQRTAEPTTVERLSALPEGQRNAVFIRAIRDAGLECQHVERSVLSGTYNGMPVWTAICAGNAEWTIVVTKAGTAQILNPNEAKLID